MLKSIFKRKPRLDHPEPNVRLQALSELAGLNESDFAKLVREDRDLVVRKAALERASSIDLYAEFLDDQQLGMLCRDFLGKNIPDDHALASDPRIIPLRMQNLSDPEQIVELTRNLGSDSEIADVLTNIPSRQVRVEALKMITDEKVLTEIEKASRNHDKTINRLVRDQLAQIKSLMRDKTSLLEQANHLIESATKTKVSEPHYVSRRRALERDWEQLLNSIEELNPLLREISRDVIDVESLNEKFPTAVDANTQKDTSSAEFESILQKLKASNDVESEIYECEREWLDALKIAAAPKEIADQFYHLANAKRREIKDRESKAKRQRSLDKLLDPLTLKEPNRHTNNWAPVWRVRDEASQRTKQIERYLSNLETDAHGSDLVQVKVQLEDMFVKVQGVIDRCDELQEETIKHIDTNLVSLSKFVDDGELKRAKSAERNVSSLIHRLPRNRQAEFQARLTPAIALIRQLAEWQEFAEAPKRIALCEAIEEVAENPLPPEEQFEMIRTLRERWNDLGILRSRDDRSLQARYDAAADKAFAVCEEWFKQQAEIRERNLEDRGKICEGLQAFLDEYDWENPNWKSVHQTLRTAQIEWRELVPVERSRSRKLSTRFHKLTKEFQSRLNQHWTDNTASKQALIDEAKAALENESNSTDSRIELIKELQAKWKTIGPATRRKEQALWNEFRETCNRVFDLRTTEKIQRRSELDANIARAHQIVNDLQDTISDDNVTLLTLNEGLVRDARREIDGIELPNRVKKQINDQLRSIASRFNDKREELEAQRTSIELIALMDLDAEMSALEISGESIDASVYEKAGASQAWFKARSAETATKKAITLHELVLRAEVLADVPSPPEDSGKRMQVQVSRLQHGLTMGGESEQQRVEKLIQDWCTFAFGVQPHRDRFQHAIRTHLASMSADPSASDD